MRLKGSGFNVQGYCAFVESVSLRPAHSSYHNILKTFCTYPRNSVVISDHQQNWGYEDGPWKGPGPLLLVAADF
jgi:hypothetical protein